MGPIFEANEEVKETLVLNFKVSRAKTILHQNGTAYVKEPFLETEIYWDSVEDFGYLTTKQAFEINDLLFGLMDKISELGGQMTTPMFEFKNGLPLMVWAQFFTKS